MIRVRLGNNWKQDPGLRAALGDGGSAADQAAASAVDALAIEVDGVDLVAGRAEGAVVAGVEALGEAVLRLLAGSARSHVHFSEGGLELVLARQGPSALLTVVTLARPSRVLAREVELDLLDLAQATAEAAEQLATDLQGLHPSRLATPARALRQLAARLGKAQPRPTEAAPSPSLGPPHQPQPRADVPTCSFELRDDEALLASYRGPGADLGSLLAPGKIALRAADGREILAVAGPPFLLLRDLSAFAGQLADAARRGERGVSAVLAGPGRHATHALEADLPAGTLGRDGRPPIPCPPLLLARAILEAAVDFCGVVAARNAWQADNGWLAELRTGSAERLAHVQELLAGDVLGEAERVGRGRRAPRLPRAPLGPGRVRRLRFRRAWEADAGAPTGFGVYTAGDVVVAAGAAAVLGLDVRTGAERWRGPGVARAVASDGLLYLFEDARLAAVDAATGRARWAQPLSALPEGARDVVRLAGGLALVLAPGAGAALDPASGVAVWRFAPPAAMQLRAGVAGSLAVIGTDTGFLHGLEAASGRQAWRVRIPGPLAAPPAALGGLCLVACETRLGGSVLGIDPSTGRRAFEVPIDVSPTHAPLPFAGLLAVAGLVAGDPVVTAIDPAGRLAWENAPALEAGPLTLAAMGSGLLVKSSQGSCVALDRAGATLWSRKAHALHPPPTNVAPIVARGVILVPGEGLEALDAATGELLGHAPMPAPVRLVADASLHAWGMDAGGVTTAVRLETHLSVIQAPAPDS
jgi:outer membrane protein assembly factor BamB